MVVVAQLVRAPGCGPGGRRFESVLPPHFFALIPESDALCRIFFARKVQLSGSKNESGESACFALSDLEDPVATLSCGCVLVARLRLSPPLGLAAGVPPLRVALTWYGVARRAKTAEAFSFSLQIWSIRFAHIIGEWKMRVSACNTRFDLLT